MPSVPAISDLQRHHAGRRQEHADHRREDDERHDARLGELVELAEPRCERLARETGRHSQELAGPLRKTAKFSITSAASKSAAPALCAAASTSGSRSNTFAMPSAACMRAAASSSRRGNAQGRDAQGRETDAPEQDDRGERPGAVAPLDGGQRLLRERRAARGHAQLAHHVKRVREIHGRHPLPVADGEIGARERRVVGADPAPERDLADEDRQSGGGPWPQSHGGRGRRRRRIDFAQREPQNERQRRHAAQRCSVTIAGLSSIVTVHMPSVACDRHHRHQSQGEPGRTADPLPQAPRRSRRSRGSGAPACRRDSDGTSPSARARHPPSCRETPRCARATSCGSSGTPSI